MDKKSILSAFGLGIIALMTLQGIIAFLSLLIFDFHFITNHLTRDIVRFYLPYLIAFLILLRISRNIQISKSDFDFKKTFRILIISFVSINVLLGILPHIQALYHGERYWEVLEDYSQYLRSPIRTANQIVLRSIADVLFSIAISIVTYLKIWRNPSSSIASRTPEKSVCN